MVFRVVCCLVKRTPIPGFVVTVCLMDNIAKTHGNSKYVYKMYFQRT